MTDERIQSDLQIKLARQLIALVNENSIAIGEHLREVEFSEKFGVSRTPVRALLTYLAENGLVEKRLNRGFFWSADADRCNEFLKTLPRTDDEVICEAIARDWFESKIEQEVSEGQIRSRYGLGRLTTQRILNLLAEDGVISRMPGYGWQFEPTLNSVTAHNESYDFRISMETSAIVSDSFVYQESVGASLRHRHNLILHQKTSELVLSDVISLDADFHRCIAECSCNRFVVQSVMHQNRLRRLLEYNSLIDTDRVRDSCMEHLAILDSLENGDNNKAAEKMRNHLLKAKVASPNFSKFE